MCHDPKGAWVQFLVIEVYENTIGQNNGTASVFLDPHEVDAGGGGREWWKVELYLACSPEAHQLSVYVTCNGHVFSLTQITPPDLLLYCHAGCQVPPDPSKTHVNRHTEIAPFLWGFPVFSPRHNGFFSWFSVTCALFQKQTKCLQLIEELRVNEVFFVERWVRRIMSLQ